MNSPHFDDFVTVLMPIFNGEKYLAEAIDSVLAQTHKNFELLLVDDHSTDNTGKIIDQYSSKDARIRKVVNTGERGLVPTLNLGIAESKWDWIARFDADDICYPERLNSQIAFLKENPDVVLLGSAFEIFGSLSEVIRHPTHPLEIAWKFTWNTSVGHPTVIFNKRIIQEFGCYPNMNAEDFALFSRISQMKHIGNLPEVLLKYRWHGANKSLVETKFMQSDVYSITANTLNALGVPEALHKPYVHFHWGTFAGIRNLPLIFLWNVRIIQKLKANLGYKYNLYVNTILISKMTYILIKRLSRQIQIRLKA